MLQHKISATADAGPFIETPVRSVQADGICWTVHHNFSGLDPPDQATDMLEHVGAAASCSPTKKKRRAKY